MSDFQPVESSFVVTNVSNRIIKALGKVPIGKGAQKDLFKAIPGLSESAILDALQAPNGSLYKDIYVNHNLRVDSYNLMLLSNLNVSLKNLKTANKHKTGQVLSVDDKGSLKWVYSDASARLQYDAPLQHSGDQIRLPKADAFTNGYLSREDWIIFKGKSKGLRIWQYQDFEGPFDNPVILSDFQNGKEISFNKNLIVDGTAVAVNVKDFNSAPRVAPGLSGVFSDKVEVTQHVRDTVFLNKVPAEKQKIRLWFLIILPDGMNVPVNYIPPTEFVRKKRIEYFDAIDVDSGGAKSIFGEKAFNDRISIRDTLSVGSDLKDSTLTVDGDLSADKVKIRDGASNGYVLTSNVVGDATWKPSPQVSSTPPKGAFHGQVWVKEPDFTTYVFDGIRGKWLAQDTFNIDGQKNATACTHVYMNGPDNIPHNVNSLSLPYDATLIGLIATGEEKQSWIAEVHVKNRLVGNSVLHVVNGDSASNMKLNVDFKAGDKVQLFASGNDIVMPYIRAIFKQRI